MDITETDIRELRQEAAQVGDAAQVEVCEAALAGDRAAWAECEEVIEEARARGAE